MSGIWFPDNVSRRDRALQLSNDITVMQQSVVEARDAMNKMDSRMVHFLDELLKNNKMATFTELQNKIEATLTPEQREQYRKLVKRSQDTSSGIDAAFMSISAITLVSGITAKTINIGNFLRTGHVMLTFKDYTKAFITIITKGYEAGKLAFKAASKSAKLAGELLEESSKMAKYASKAARILKVIAVLGVIADAILLGYAFFAEKKQRDELRTAITELYVRRIISKFYERLAGAVKTQDGMMVSYLILVSDSGTIDPDDQRAADKIANKLIKYVQDDWKDVDTTSSLDLLISLDHRRGSWMDDDPSYNEAIKQADELKESDEKAETRAAPAAYMATSVAPRSAPVAYMTVTPERMDATTEHMAAPANEMAVGIQNTEPTLTGKVALNNSEVLSGNELDIELEEISKSFAEYLPSSTVSSDGGYTMGIQDLVVQIHKMVDMDIFDKAAIIELFD